jgi:hypothetical protein
MKRFRLFLLGITLSCVGVGVAQAQTTQHAGPIAAVVAARGPSCSPACKPAQTTSSNWVDVPGGNVQIRLNSNSLIVARFTSGSSCVAHFRTPPLNELQPGWCAIRMLVSPAQGAAFSEMIPATAHYDTFQQDGDQGTHSIERSAGPVSPGLVTVKLQYVIPFAEPGSSFTLNGWHMTVEAASLQ